MSHIADDLAGRLVSEPERHDVVLLAKLCGDVLSATCCPTQPRASSVVSGSRPAGATATAARPSSPHTALRLVGQGGIHLTATLLSGAMMLEYLGFEDEARRLVHARERGYAEGKCLTPDQGGTRSTRDVCDAVARPAGL
jgi:isocitrate/isopropylmalate dehydrogenase